MITQKEAYNKAYKLYPPENGVVPVDKIDAYVRGYLDSMLDSLKPVENFYEQVAIGLRKLWPSGEKDGKYPWRDSVQNLKKRLEFIWTERKYADRFTVEDCLTVGRRYLSQFESDVKYMQTLKYFIFKQTKLIASDGKITYTYKSTFADMLESNPQTVSEFDDLFETTTTYEQGELI